MRQKHNVLEVRKRRQMMTLAALSVVAVVLVGTRLLSQPPARVAANDDGVTTSSDANKDDNAFSSVQRIEVTWPVQLERDLFAWESVLPRPHQTPTRAVVEAGPDAAAIWREAQRLQVRGILMDEPPKAMINGRLWLQGQTVSGFRIVRIDPRQIVVEKLGVEINIEL